MPEAWHLEDFARLKIIDGFLVLRAIGWGRIPASKGLGALLRAFPALLEAL